MPIDPDFLKRYFTEAESRMRWRADVEYRLLTTVLTTDALVVTVMGLTLKGAGPNYVLCFVPVPLLLALFVSALVAVLGAVITHKVNAEHKEYEILGQHVVKVWEYFGLYEPDAKLSGQPFLAPPSRNYGKGLGYQRTTRIIWACTALAVVICVAIGVLASIVPPTPTVPGSP